MKNEAIPKHPQTRHPTINLLPQKHQTQLVWQRTWYQKERMKRAGRAFLARPALFKYVHLYQVRHPGPVILPL
ncbi:hypothetical protein [Thalassobacillus sp. CUG 92003]|uniref:hypothetical protein n=1 Tax=Thalassobacillus sp. CUG 92003 TaxID=2736641 RepID=UPI0015E644DE|nr:hypothetical protein [Thalassobacillus sp. CUG 92003]